ncbi:uncharacterized protein [Labrus bergylta]|uniref:uncharacterized protein n=1 Tax=Labrus bergylta TaxID=56723 RepID=UPI0033133350
MFYVVLMTSDVLRTTALEARVSELEKRHRTIESESSYAEVVSQPPVAGADRHSLASPPVAPEQPGGSGSFTNSDYWRLHSPNVKLAKSAGIVRCIPRARAGNIASHLKLLTKTKADPPKPKLTHLKSAIQGLPFVLTCTVLHTCPSRAPKLTWSRGTADGIAEVNREIHAGNWEMQSILTFIPEDKDDHSDVTCTSTFNGGRTSSETLTLYVKRRENYNHIIIPTVVGIGTAVIFAFFCLFMVKKYKARIAELQSQDGNVWNRLSRLSHRIRSNGPGPSQSEQRRSIWSRFSRVLWQISKDSSTGPERCSSCTDQNQEMGPHHSCPGFSALAPYTV